MQLLPCCSVPQIHEDEGTNLVQIRHDVREQTQGHDCDERLLENESNCETIPVGLQLRIVLRKDPIRETISSNARNTSDLTTATILPHDPSPTSTYVPLLCAFTTTQTHATNLKMTSSNRILQLHQLHLNYSPTNLPAHTTLTCELRGRIIKD